MSAFMTGNVRSNGTASKGRLLIGSVLVAGAMMFAGAAQAAPLSLGKSATTAFEPEVSLVRDGCGRGWRFSNRRGECVPEYDGRQRFHDDRHDGRHDGRRGRNNDSDAAAIAAGAVMLGIIAAGANKNRNHSGNARPHNPNFKKKNR